MPCGFSGGMTSEGFMPSDTDSRVIRLAPLPEGFEKGRRNLHQVAYFALAPKRYAETGRLGLRHTGSGFGTPAFVTEERAGVEGDRLILEKSGEEVSAPIVTLRQACNLLAIPYEEEWFPDFRDPLAPAGPDTVLAVDPAVSRALAAWQTFAGEVLERTRRLGGPDDELSELQLWPEHFDQAFEMGSADRGTRAGYGASPCDDPHPGPYLYVAPWRRRERSDDYWNDPTFQGQASLTPSCCQRMKRSLGPPTSSPAGYDLLTREIETSP